MSKISKIVVKLWVGNGDMEQKTQVVISKMRKLVLKTRIAERRTVIMTQRGKDKVQQWT